MSSASSGIRVTDLPTENGKHPLTLRENESAFCGCTNPLSTGTAYPPPPAMNAISPPHGTRNEAGIISPEPLSRHSSSSLLPIWTQSSFWFMVVDLCWKRSELNFSWSSVKAACFEQKGQQIHVEQEVRWRIEGDWKKEVCPTKGVLEFALWQCGDKNQHSTFFQLFSFCHL